MAMPTSWTPDQLNVIESAHELEITTARPDGALRRWVPIWVVRADTDIYVRTWQLRETGWFGRAVRSGRARVRVPGCEADVEVTQVGTGDDGLRAAVDAAYRDKYGGDGGSVGRMTGEEAAASTLRLDPVDVARATDQ
jgi:hypothetical protein